MERIVYRKTLDAHKNGIQFTLQGFETADNMARRIEISLMSSGDTIDLPLEQITAIMYLTTPNATEPSINECVIKDNKIVCDVQTIVEEGITEVQLKLIETSPEGAKMVVATPKFAIEVLKSNTDDESAMQTTTYTALENAIAKANGVYESRLLRIELDADCMFRAYYADGTVYESDVLKELFLKGDALLSQSYARGGTGVRAGEDTDNSMYYSTVSKSAALEAYMSTEKSAELLEETRKHGVYTAFSVDFETGEVQYVSPHYTFDVNEENGELEVVDATYTFEETIHFLVTEWLAKYGVSVESLEEIANTHTLEIEGLQTSLDTVISHTIPELDNRIKANEDNISQLGETVSNNYNTLSGEISDIKTNLTTLEGDVNTLEESFSLLNEDKIRIEEDIATLQGNTTKNASAIESVTKRVTTIETARAKKGIELFLGDSESPIGRSIYNIYNYWKVRVWIDEARYFIPCDVQIFEESMTFEISGMTPVYIGPNATTVMVNIRGLLSPSTEMNGVVNGIINAFGVARIVFSANGMVSYEDLTTTESKIIGIL